MALSSPLPCVAESSDQELLRQARAGDRHALDALARRHRQAAFLLALQMLGNREDAMDAAQDALLRFCVSLDRFQTGRAVRPWLLTIVRNRCRDMMRRRRVRRTEPLDQQDGGWRPELADRSASPEQLAQRRELQRRVWTALAGLAEPHREILVLRDYQDLGYAEIAEVLGIPLGTVMSRLHRARNQLRLRLRSERDPAECPAKEADDV